MEIKPIHTEKDYQEALTLASNYFDNEPEPNTPEGNAFDVLITLIESYEAKNFPIDLPDPIEAIKFRLEQSGQDIKALSPMIGQMNRVYEVMNHKRSLTLSMIRRLYIGLGIPADSLIMPSTIKTRDAKRSASIYVSRPRVHQSSSTSRTVKLSSGRKTISTPSKHPSKHPSKQAA
jgi:HTH-type transcriptional regulator/antitoxin HigA